MRGRIGLFLAVLVLLNAGLARCVTSRIFGPPGADTRVDQGAARPTAWGPHPELTLSRKRRVVRHLLTCRPLPPPSRSLARPQCRVLRLQQAALPGGVRDQVQERWLQAGVRQGEGEWQDELPRLHKPLRHELCERGAGVRVRVRACALMLPRRGLLATCWLAHVSCAARCRLTRCLPA